MRLKMTSCFFAIGLCVFTASAQTPEGVVPGKMVQPSKALDDLLQQLEEETMMAVKAMPADKYNFAPTAATFAPTQNAKFEGVRTFGQQVKHVAEANYHFASAMSGLKPDRDRDAIESLTEKDDIVKALADSYAFVHKAYATVTLQNAFETIKGVDGNNNRAMLGAYVVTHGFDHYGQMYEYLRMNGIVAPTSAGAGAPPK